MPWKSRASSLILGRLFSRTCQTGRTESDRLTLRAEIALLTDAAADQNLFQVGGSASFDRRAIQDDQLIGTIGYLALTADRTRDIGACGLLYRPGRRGI